MGNEENNEEINTDEVITFIKEIGIDKFNEFRDSFKKEEPEKKEEEKNVFSDEQIKLITTIISKAMEERDAKPEPEKKQITKKEANKRQTQPEIKPLNLAGNDTIGYI